MVLKNTDDYISICLYCPEIRKNKDVRSLMTFKKTVISVLLALAALILSCGADPADSIILNGRIILGHLDQNMGFKKGIESEPGQIYVIISKTEDFAELVEDPDTFMAAMFYVENGEEHFSVDLSDTDIRAGDEVSILAFMDFDFIRGVPSPTRADLLGFYMNPENLGTLYQVKAGGANFFDIKIWREVFDFDVEISGSVECDEAGDVILVAYRGDSDSISSSNLDMDAVVGYSRITKGPGRQDFTLSVMPYGYALPIEDVQIFAILDKNSNGSLDDGDVVGYNADDDGVPETVDINACGIAGVDISISRNYYETDAKVKGEVSCSGDDCSDGDLMIVVYSGSADELEGDDFDIDSITGYTKHRKGEYAFPFNYTVDVLPFNNGFPLQDISIFAILDKNGNERPDNGEVLGFYTDEGDMTPVVTLPEWGLSDINININKTYNENDIRIEGSISGADPVFDLILVALQGDISKISSSSFDVDSVIAYKKYSAGDYEIPVIYSMELLPFFAEGSLIEDVSVFAVLDKNMNGKLDDSDMLGYYIDESGLPESFDMAGTENVTGIDIEIEKVYHENDAKVEGTVTAEGMPVQGEVIVIAYAGGWDSLDNNSFDASLVMGYEKYTKEAGDLDYELSIIPFFDLAVTSYEDVSVFAVLDINDNGIPDDGDRIGFYSDDDGLPKALVINEGIQQNVDVVINRDYYDNNASINGTVTGGANGDLLVIAYAGEMDSMEGDDFDAEKIIAYQQYTKSGTSYNYSIDVFPFFSLTPQLENISVFAVLDNNHNGKPDDYDLIGFYSDSDGRPVGIDVGPAGVTGINIEIDKTYFNNNTYISGTVSGAGTGDMYVVAYNGDLMGMSTAEPDTKYIVAYGRFTKQGEELDYSIKVNPFYNLKVNPVEDVLVMAWLDRGTADIMDTGDRIGFHAGPGSDDMIPTLSVPEEGLSGVNLVLNRDYYDHNAAFEFRLSDENISSGDNILVLLMHEGGVDRPASDFDSNWRITDLNYVLGYQNFTVSSNYDTFYKIDVTGFIYEGINVNMGRWENLWVGPWPWDFHKYNIIIGTSGDPGVYLFAIKDSNRNMKPDRGELLGYYANYMLSNVIPTKLWVENANHRLGEDGYRVKINDIELTGSD